MVNLRNTKRAALELITHEGAVLEAYKDSVGVWTWGIGITNASGHNVDRYRRNPTSLAKVLEVYLWALQRYEDDVVRTFAPMELNEHQLAAATSFHYNTGAIRRASWVKKFKKGDIKGARRAFMSWSKPKEIIGRRRAERDLFFDGKWHNDGKVNLYTKVTSSGNIVWSSMKRVDARKALDDAWDAGTQVASFVGSVAAKDRMSTSKIVSAAVGGGLGIGGVAQTLEEVGYTVEVASGLFSSLPSWVLPVALFAGAALAWYLWKERDKYQKQAQRVQEFMQ